MEIKPSAPVPTGTIPRYNSSPPRVTFDGNIIEDMPSAPPLELMDQVRGYESVSFNAVSIPPPDCTMDIVNQGKECFITAVEPLITECQARTALLSYTDKHCCYGKRVPIDMAISALKYSSAFHYELETFTEKRQTSWAYRPYVGEDIDGEGTVPLPWAVDVPNSNHLFESKEHTRVVPHTSSVKPCHTCQGAGTVRCTKCSGSESHCCQCGTRGTAPCSVCAGRGRLLCYIQLTVSRRTHLAEHVVTHCALPERLTSLASGRVAFEEQAERVCPLTTFPDETINMASAQLVRGHHTELQDKKILAQRHQVRIVPITAVQYEWRKHSGVFYIYGYEKRIYAPDYPQTCCWGCNII